MQVRINKQYLDGENHLLERFGCPSVVPPQLDITGTTATLFAVTLVDISTPTPYVHWVVWNYPGPDQTTGLNRLSTNTYLPPCPPEDAGDHEYVFTVYAQPGAMHLPSATTLEELQRQVHTFPTAKTSMKYARRKRPAS